MLLTLLTTPSWLEDPISSNPITSHPIQVNDDQTLVTYTSIICCLDYTNTKYWEQNHQPLETPGTTECNSVLS